MLVGLSPTVALAKTTMQKPGVSTKQIPGALRHAVKVLLGRPMSLSEKVYYKINGHLSEYRFDGLRVTADLHKVTDIVTEEAPQADLFYVVKALESDMLRNVPPEQIYRNLRQGLREGTIGPPKVSLDEHFFLPLQYAARPMTPRPVSPPAGRPKNSPLSNAVLNVVNTLFGQYW
jgi:hypothetical protein